MNLVLAIATFTGLLIAADEQATRRWDFEDAKVGELPNGWSAAKTGSGEGSVWKVLEDSSAPKGSKVLAQTSPDGPNPLFNLCIADDASYIDVDLSVAMKPLEGDTDQGGGLVWRYKDPNNYYIARMNPLEDNYRVYKVVNGKRAQLGTAEVEAPAGKWHTIRIVQQDNRILCYFNEKLYLDVKDDTFKDAGKIGLWTKADAQTSFDDLKASGK